MKTFSEWLVENHSELAAELCNEGRLAHYLAPLLMGASALGAVGCKGGNCDVPQQPQQPRHMQKLNPDVDWRKPFDPKTAFVQDSTPQSPSGSVKTGVSRKSSSLDDAKPWQPTQGFDFESHANQVDQEVEALSGAIEKAGGDPKVVEISYRGMADSVIKKSNESEALHREYGKTSRSGRTVTRSAKGRLYGMRTLLKHMPNGMTIAYTVYSTQPVDLLGGAMDDD